MIRTIICGLLLCGGMGCATKTAERMSSRTWTTNRLGDVIYEEKETKGAAFMTWGDARQLVEKARLSNGKTHSIGLSGYDSETTTTNVPAILKGAGGLIGEAVGTYQKSIGLALPVP